MESPSGTYVLARGANVMSLLEDERWSAQGRHEWPQHVATR